MRSHNDKKCYVHFASNVSAPRIKLKLECFFYNISYIWRRIFPQRSTKVSTLTFIRSVFQYFCTRTLAYFRRRTFTPRMLTHAHIFVQTVLEQWACAILTTCRSFLLRARDARYLKYKPACAAKWQLKINCFRTEMRRAYCTRLQRCCSNNSIFCRLYWLYGIVLKNSQTKIFTLLINLCEGDTKQI